MTKINPKLIDKTDFIKNAASVSTKETYSCNYINNSDTYSLNEVKTNQKWIDSKPIYRKVGTGTSASGSAVAVNMGLANISTITKMYGVYNTIYPIPYSTTTAGFTIEMYRNGQNINVVFGSSITPATFYIVVEYTKTSD